MASSTGRETTVPWAGVCRPQASQMAAIILLFSSRGATIITKSCSSCREMPSIWLTCSEFRRRPRSTVPPLAPAARAASMTSSLYPAPTETQITLYPDFSRISAISFRVLSSMRCSRLARASSFSTCSKGPCSPVTGMVMTMPPPRWWKWNCCPASSSSSFTANLGSSPMVMSQVVPPSPKMSSSSEGAVPCPRHWYKMGTCTASKIASSFFSSSGRVMASSIRGAASLASWGKLIQTPPRSLPQYPRAKPRQAGAFLSTCARTAAPSPVWRSAAPWPPGPPRQRRR